MTRVRFAPSPTGPLHIGGVRTALFNYLFAKKNNGVFILRIEDTDQQRYVEGAEKYIIESLEWAGLKFDEGPHIGGNFSPYKQSERKDIYFDYAKKLVDEDKAYYAFDTAEMLEEARKQNPNFQYDKSTRLKMKNSLTIQNSDVESFINSGNSYVIRVKIPENEQIEVNDMIRGKVVFDSNLLDDKVIFKSDGFPTYHLANVIDDYLMKISHVIRGEEWLPSTPLHVVLYRYFGWEHPKFAHLPLILKPQGSGKLSKRDGDKMGFPVFPCNWKDPKTGELSKGYKEWGFLPEAFVNMLALLGWNPGSEKEIFSISELIDSFDIEQVQKAGAKFDLEKTKWFNHQYLNKIDLSIYLDTFKKIINENNAEANDIYILNVIEKIKDRLFLISEFWENSYYFFIEPTEYNTDIINKFKTESSSKNLKDICKLVANINKWEVENIETSIKEYLNNNNLKIGSIFNLLRVALTGTNHGIGIMDIIFIIGKEKSINRIEKLSSFIK